MKYYYKFTRWCLHIFFRLQRGMTLGVRAIVRSPTDEILLVRHPYTVGWHFPGGGIETGQDAVTALKAELFQETGLRFSKIPKLHGIFFNKSVSKRDHIIVYACEVEDFFLDCSKTWEISEVKFFSLDNLPSDVDPGTQRRIDELCSGIVSSTDW